MRRVQNAGEMYKCDVRGSVVGGKGSQRRETDSLEDMAAMKKKTGG